MKFLHISEPCLAMPEPLMYASDAGKHRQPLEPIGGYPPGDRTLYMTCQYCDHVLWGHYCITEFPYN